MMELWPALAMGLAGSLHCAGMCGPIALALPRPPSSRAAFLAGRLLYNLGRIATYAALGAVAGLAGRTLALAGFQQALSILAGVALLAAAGFGRMLDAKSSRVTLAVTGAAWFRRAWRAAIGQATPARLFGTGVLNGLLPCGLVYAAFAAAAAAGSMARSIGFMALFGAGTLPMMFALACAGGMIQGALRRRLQFVIPVTLAVLGVLFILRGLNLGIPYLSPKFGPAGASCCH
jgi:hypothetical protein